MQTNPKYIGANIYNRRSFKLKHKRINNPVDTWIWREGAVVPIVGAAIFEQVHSIAIECLVRGAAYLMAYVYPFTALVPH